MRRFALIALVASLASAQDTASLFNRAPKEIDDALRARIDQFYQLCLKRDFRHAEALVAEDTKDFFYDNTKPEILGYEISRIDYTDGYTHAKAMILEDRVVMFPGFTDKPVKIPTPSYWKIDNGKWSWYVDKSKIYDTPFGTMKPGPPSSGTSVASVVRTLPTDVEQLMDKVKTDKSEVTLKPGESAKVLVGNGMQGPVMLVIQGKLTGIEAALDRATIPATEQATLTIKAADDATSGTITLNVSPLGKAMPIRVTIAK
jgi:hypothetical protein